MDILERIAVHKKFEIEQMKIDLPLETIKSQLLLGKYLYFKNILSDRNKINIIAEIKKGSPSKGIISKDFDPEELAKLYKEGGASALSVLTDEKFFYGSFENLKKAKEVSSLPVLCKDFFIDSYQLYFANYIGADAVLLIVKMLSKEKLKEFLSIAKDLGLDALVEVHDEKELEIALEAKAEIIGVNNRNLNTFEVDIQTAVDLSKLIPEDIIKVAESGIFTADDIRKLKSAGYNNFLIGEALVTAENPVELLKELQLL